MKVVVKYNRQFDFQNNYLIITHVTFKNLFYKIRNSFFHFELRIISLSLHIAGDINLAGSYGCEVSSEGPSFETDYREANMSVAVPPKGPPILDGVRPYYEIGEILEAECTSGLSYPPAVLTFILNGKEVSR